MAGTQMVGTPLVSDTPMAFPAVSHHLRQPRCHLDQVLEHPGLCTAPLSPVHAAFITERVSFYLCHLVGNQKSSTDMEFIDIIYDS